MKLFHSTRLPEADQIESNGYLGSSRDDSAGIRLSDRVPMGADLAARLEAVHFELDVPDNFPLDEWKIIEDGRPSNALREWLVPASNVNQWPRARWEGQTEFD